MGLTPMHQNPFALQIDTLDKSIIELQRLLHECIKDVKLEQLSDETLEQRIKWLQLILQYRMDTQDILIRLLQLDHGLLQALGIAPAHPSLVNLERLSFALGHDDLQQLLHALGQLMDSLLRMTHRLHTHHALTPLHSQSSLTKLQRAFEKQKQVICLVITLQETAEQLIQHPEAGPLFDHIAALRGPISHFLQAIQHGIAMTQELYHSLSSKTQAPLDELRQKTEAILAQISICQPQPTLFHPACETTSERLEQRACAKRLGHFFH